MANEHIINNNLIVTGSITSSVGFSGDGSGLTNLSAPSAEWDGSRDGNASITGSFIVSGSSVVVNFQNTEEVLASRVSGSFSGSFAGNGSNLTGIPVGGNNEVQFKNNQNFDSTSNFKYLNGALLVSESIQISKSGSGNLKIQQDSTEPFNVSSITVQGKTGTNFGALKIISKNYGGTSKNLFELKDGYAIFHEHLILTGSNKKVDFTRASAISGSTFSGSFVGNGSGLTGISTEWDGSRNGDAEITGSFIVSGSSTSVQLLGDTTIDQNIEISNRNQESDIAIGYQALPESSIERNNIAIGFKAGHSQVSGSNSILIGQCAGYFGVKVKSNIAIGNNALKNNTGIDNGGTTNQANNIAIGHNALFLASTGASNVAVGDSAMYYTTTGKQSVAIGFNAGRKTTTGLSNVFVGYGAGYCNTVSSNSVYIGMQSGYYSSGRGNVALGSEALRGPSSGVTGTYNTALGHRSGVAASGNSFKNVYIGNNAGPTSTTSQYCQLYIGVSSGETPLIRGNFYTGVVTINDCLKVAEASGSFIGDGSGLTGVSGAGFPYAGAAQITGSLIVSQSAASGTAVTIEQGHVILSQVSSSLNAHDDLQAASLGVPKGGLYRNGNFIQIRIT